MRAWKGVTALVPGEDLPFGSSSSASAAIEAASQGAGTATNLGVGGMDVFIGTPPSSPGRCDKGRASSEGRQLRVVTRTSYTKHGHTQAILSN